MHGRYLPLDDRSRQLRRAILTALQSTRQGNFVDAFALVEVLRVLYDDVLRYDTHNPDWSERDRCILSTGQGRLALHAVLADKGFFPADELKTSHAGGASSVRKLPGVEAACGSPGHGLSLGVGFALRARLAGTASRVFVILGEDECGLGATWEAAAGAARYGLSNLVAVIDQPRGPAGGGSSSLAEKWASFGFAVREVDGHDVHSLREILAGAPFEACLPGAVVCRTVKGRGVDFAEKNARWHAKSTWTDSDVKSLFSAIEAA
jgi:transketolase